MKKQKQEQLEVVNEQGQVMSLQPRERIHREGLLHREIHVWLYNDDGEILLNLRGPDKDTYPNMLDASVGGHVNPGENYTDAAKRELKEEFHITVAPQDLHEIKEMRRKSYDQVTKNTNNTIRRVFAYHFRSDKNAITFDTSEVAGYEWWPIDKLGHLTPDEQKRFIYSLYSRDYLDLYQQIKKLI